jgi:hypothetical protein
MQRLSSIVDLFTQIFEIYQFVELHKYICTTTHAQERRLLT